ncbi:conserved protein of unknown function [Paenibacillus alvei]|uniref:Uncharacterized protein n=1 Tax=Paenibacillus alvei TaxID=44250 RepID=A0A383RJB7_PAEAL|nr:class I SAM-dependent methyltransferase [Paenibacillus alvei]SYX86459.1 conserved protein of unknown function [Paenibacillus alvei]
MNQWKISEPKFESDGINDKLRVAPWEGHRRFAYDFINFMKPKNIVELGTHYGCSFFSFCQSVKDFKLRTKLYAIDTWSGDEQAGFYEEEVYDTVGKTVKTFFQDIDVTLLRKTFDEALDDLEDSSIDLIHIDGLHTYEAVSHDFETWLPKLKDNGVIMFHDVFSPLEYGSNQFWKEIKSRFPYYEFKHSWGLGILFPKGDEIFEQLMDENIKDKILYYTNKSLYEFEMIKTKDLETMVTERDKAIKSNEKLINEKDIIIEKNELMIQARDSALASSKELIEARDNALSSAQEMIKARDEALSTAKTMIEARDEALRSSEEMIKERDALIKSMEKQLTDIKESNSILKDKMNELTNLISEKKIELEQKQQMIDYYQNKKIILNFRKK